MTKAAQVIIIGLLIAAGIFFFMTSKVQNKLFGTPSEPESTTESTETTRKVVEVPLIKERLHKDTNTKRHIDIAYPELSLVKNPKLAEEANTVIASFISDIEEDFERNVTELPIGEMPDGMNSDLVLRYTPLLISPEFVSMRFDYSAYYAGAAHPDNQSRTFNYDLLNRRQLTSEELFASTTEALPFYSEHSRGVLRLLFQELSDEEFALTVTPGTEPIQENYKEVGVTKEGLLVIFNPYQVAPYARGIQEVRIPLGDLTGKLAPPIEKAIAEATENMQEATPIELMEI